MRATSPGSAARTFAMASATKSRVSPPSGDSRSQSDGRARGAERRGPPSSGNAKSTPSADSGSRMSEKMMAASKPNRRMGCSVTSAASSGLRHSARNDPARSRVRRYSGR